MIEALPDDVPKIIKLPRRFLSTFKRIDALQDRVNPLSKELRILQEEQKSLKDTVNLFILNEYPEIMKYEESMVMKQSEDNPLQIDINYSSQMSDAEKLFDDMRKFMERDKDEFGTEDSEDN